MRERQVPSVLFHGRDRHDHGRVRGECGDLGPGEFGEVHGADFFPESVRLTARAENLWRMAWHGMP